MTIERAPQPHEHEEHPAPLTIINSDGSVVTLDDAYVRSIEQARRARLAAPVFSDQDLAEMRERNPDEAWLWTREAQDSLRRAEEDIEARRLTRFSSDEDFLRSLAGRDADADV